jgi:hypothetical protein
MKKIGMLVFAVMILSTLAGCSAENTNDTNPFVNVELKTSSGLILTMDPAQTLTFKAGDPFWLTATVQSNGQVISSNQNILFHDHDVTHDVTYNHIVPSGQEFSINTNINNPRNHEYQLTPGTHELTFIYHDNNNQVVSTTFYVVVL